MKAQSASAPLCLDAASTSQCITFQRDAINLPPKVKRKTLACAREENAGTENDAKEVQASATRIVVRLSKHAAKQTRGKGEKSKAKAKGKGKAKAFVAIKEKSLDDPECTDAERPSKPLPAQVGTSEVEAETGRRRSQRMKAAVEASAQMQSR